MMHDGVLFNGMSRDMYAGDTFRACGFNGQAKECNFDGCVFEACTFEPGFKFVSCLLTRCTGIEAVPKQDCNYSTPADFERLHAQLDGFPPFLKSP
jgi:hypothetical protein